MSIIYDALQKTQRNREYLKLQNALHQKKAQRLQVKSLSAVLMVLLASGCIGALATLYWPFPKKASTAKMGHATLKSVAPTLQGEHLWVTDNTKISQPAVQPKIAAPVQVASADAIAVTPVSPPADFSGAPLTTAEANPVSAPLNQAGLTLNGVLISGIEKIALINNQSFHLGDIVQGKKIVAIDFNSVMLQEGQSVFELKVPV